MPGGRTFHCPRCGAKLDYDHKTDQLVCNRCGARYDSPYDGPEEES